MRQLLLPIFVLALAVAAPAAAQLGSDCEDSPDGCGNPAPPSAPSLPDLASKSGSYGVFINDNFDYRQGYVTGDQTTYFGGGPYQPIGGDGTLTVGIADSTVTLKGDLTPEATALATASAATHYAAQGGFTVGYLVELHAASAAAFAALTPLLETSGAIASISGHYTLGATGQAFAQAYALTGATSGFPLDPSLQQTAGATCDYSGYVDTTGSGCGTTGYTLDLNFVKGSSFTDGNALSIYGTIELSTSVHAGRTSTDGVAGTASAFIDPTITLNPLFNSPLYTLNIGNAIVPVPGAVPEPAAWALMLAGFGAVGGAARRSRMRTVAA